MNFRLRENGTSIKTPAAKVVQNTKVKVVSYTRWTRRGPPRLPGDSRTLSPASGNVFVTWDSVSEFRYEEKPLFVGTESSDLAKKGFKTDRISLIYDRRAQPVHR